eukprot:s860_g23.t1
MFLSDNKQPSRCSPYCQWQNISFPVQFHFRSRHAKDVAKHDDKEKPVLILPNLAFKVVRGDHRPLLCHVHSRAGEAVQDRKMDGKGFSAWEVDGEYDMLDLEGAEYRPFFDALASRFEMPPRAGLDDTQATVGVEILEGERHPGS